MRDGINELGTQLSRFDGGTHDPCVCACLRARMPVCESAHVCAPVCVSNRATVQFLCLDVTKEAFQTTSKLKTISLNVFRRSFCSFFFVVLSLFLKEAEAAPILQVETAL